MNRVEVWLSDDSLGPDTRIGWLIATTGRAGESIRFEYEADWLSRRTAVAPFDLDPMLPAFPGPHHPRGENALFGIFRDTSPDRWGRILMERREIIDARDGARAPKALREWDFLLGVADHGRMGALRLKDSDSGAFVADKELSVPPLARLRELENMAAELERPGAEERPEYRAWLTQLTDPGTSLGGARPKASYRDVDGSIWLAKFPVHDDRRDIGLWEFVAASLARQSGVSVPDHRTHKFSTRGHTFAARRFDRAGNSRRLYASAMTLAGKSEGQPGSYLDIAEIIETQGDPSRIRNDLEQLYRRVLFSILIGNRDDHLRNHGFLRARNGWVLSPAFDINPNPDKAEHALAIDEVDASPTSSTLNASRDYYRLTSKQAAELDAEVRGVVGRWKEEASSVGLSRSDIAGLDNLIVAGR